MLLRFLSLLFLCILFCSSAFAEVEIKRVAVLEFRGVAIEEAMLLKLSDQARAAAVDTLGKEEYLIMTRENMLQVLDDMGKDASCIEGACEVEIGRNIGADLIITGDILKIESSYVLTLKLYETKTGGLLKLTEVEEEGLLPLKNDTYTQSVLLLQDGLELTREVPLEDWKKLTLGEIGANIKKKFNDSKTVQEVKKEIEEEKKKEQESKKKKRAEKKSKSEEKEKKANNEEKPPGTKSLKMARRLMIIAGTTYTLTALTRLGYATADTLGDARSAYKVNNAFSSTTGILVVTSTSFYLYGRRKMKKAEKEE